MALNSFDDLKDTILSYIRRPGDTSIPVADFVRLAETDVQPLIRHYLAENTETITSADKTVTLPDDFLEARALHVSGYLVRPVSPHDATLAADEIGYHFHGNQIVLSSLADGPFDVDLTYYARFPSLSTANISNWLLQRFPAVYLHGSLIRAYRWLGDVENEQLERASLGEALGLVDQDNRRGSVAYGNTIISGGNSAW